MELKEVDEILTSGGIVAKVARQIIKLDDAERLHVRHSK